MFLLLFFFALGRYVAISRKPLHCAVAFTVAAFLAELLKSSFLPALGYALVVLPVAVGTYFLLDRFEDQLVQWLGITVLGGCLVTFGPMAVAAKLRGAQDARTAATMASKRLTYAGKSYRFSYPASWILKQQGNALALRSERGLAAGILMVNPEGRVTSNLALKAELERHSTIRETSKLGGLPGFQLEDDRKIQGFVLDHRYVYALTSDTMHIDFMVGGEGTERQALVKEAEAIEASWRWSPSAI